MKIADISLAEVALGKMWHLDCSDDDFLLDVPIEELGPISERSDLHSEDYVVYSGLTVYGDGQVKPLLLLKELGDADYGGDWLEYVEGGWRQLGLFPNPDAQIGETFLANPHPLDPSFQADSHDERQRQRSGFARHAEKLTHAR